MDLRDEVVMAADVGGTNTTLAIITVKDLKILYKEHELTKNISSFSKHVNAFIATVAKRNLAPRRGCFAVAGPVTTHEGKQVYRQVALTNSSLVISEEDLLEQTALEQAYIINDLEAVAYGTLALNEDNNIVIQKGTSNPKQTRIIVSLGTGLGCARLEYSERTKMYYARGMELAHADIPMVDEEEFRLLQFIKHSESVKGNITHEHLLSGRGIERIYEFYAHESLDVKRILEKSDGKSKQAKEKFIQLFARCCKNLLVEHVAQGGLYIAGGIVAKHPELFDEKFLKLLGLHGKENFKELIQKNTVRVLTDYTISLKGAAQAIILT